MAAVLRVRPAQGWQRAFSTCTSHLTVVLLNCMPPVCIYLQPCSAGAGAGAPAVFYTIITPTLTPFIYTPRNKEVKRALQRLLRGGCRESPAHPLTCVVTLNVPAKETTSPGAKWGGEIIQVKISTTKGRLGGAVG